MEGEESGAKPPELPGYMDQRPERDGSSVAPLTGTLAAGSTTSGAKGLASLTEDNMGDGRRDPKVSFRLPKPVLNAIDDLADDHNVSRSALLRRFVSFGLESNAEAVAVEARINKLREEIIEFGSPIDTWGGFEGRVRENFEERWKNGYSAEALKSKAENYRREARMIEEEVPKHPDAPPIEEGEMVEKVEHILRETLEAKKLSNWQDRYRNPYERFEGVESGIEARRFTLAVLRSALEMDRDLEPLRSSIKSERRVRGDDLPELAEDDLPDDVDRERVAEVARQLADNGVTPDMMDTDPDEFDPFGWTDSTAEVVEQDGTPALPETEPDGGAALRVSPDGGDHEAIQAFYDGDDDGNEGDQDGEERDLADLVEWAAEVLRDGRYVPRDAYTDAKNEKNARQARERAEKRVRGPFESETTDWKTELMDQSTLTPGDLIELADDYNAERDRSLDGDRDGAPRAVADGNGGVRVE